MAKRGAAAAVADVPNPVDRIPGTTEGGDGARPVLVEELSKGLKKELDGWRKQVDEVAGHFQIVKVKSKEMAAPIMAFFGKLVGEFGDGRMTFVNFVRLFNPNLPERSRDNPKTNEKGYLSDPTYYTLAYMRQVNRNAIKPKGKQGRRDPAVDREARLLKTILMIVKPEAQDVVWEAFRQEFGLEDRGEKTMRRRVEAAAPILDLDEKVKPVAVDEDLIHHVARVRADSSGVSGGPADVVTLEQGKGRRRQRVRAAAATLARPGRRVGINDAGERVPIAADARRVS